MRIFLTFPLICRGTASTEQGCQTTLWWRPWILGTHSKCCSVRLPPLELNLVLALFSKCWMNTTQFTLGVHTGWYDAYLYAKYLSIAWRAGGHVCWIRNSDINNVAFVRELLMLLQKTKMFSTVLLSLLLTFKAVGLFIFTPQPVGNVWHVSLKRGRLMNSVLSLLPLNAANVFQMSHLLHGHFSHSCQVVMFRFNETSWLH